MNYVGVYVEHSSLSLNQTFTYATREDVRPGCRVRVPFGSQTLVGFVNKNEPKPDLDNIKEIQEVIDQEPILNEELLDLAQKMSDFYVCSRISCYKAMLPPALKPSSTRATIVQEQWVIKGDTSVSLTKRQQEVLDSTTFPVKASVFRKQAKSIAKTLIDKGVVRLESRDKVIDLLQENKEDTDFALTDEQTNAIELISHTEKRVSLLHGVTGSGKTEVFLQLAQQALDQNRQVLFLVPEIGLTPMMIDRVQARFGDRIAIYHSQLSAQEKYNQYCRVRDGQADIVIGTRSAIFLPLQNIGLILMDEEHDSSYKQDSSPRYVTKDVALWRAEHHDCKLVLSSATPSLDSYSRAYKGNYELVSLKHRIYHQMPSIELINMKEEQANKGISASLQQAIQETLDRKEQIILLLNRRGYMPVVRCMDCNEVITCPECGLALSYHKQDNALLCHCCGITYSFHHECPKCHGHRFFNSTIGTETLEERISQLYPQAHIVRMDADSTRKKNSHAKKLAEFEEKGDILLGTQMVAKGLDFPRVTLVGILNADASLARLDYRSSENAFDLLVQASGRSGREKKAGRVLIQTFDPNHYVMQCVKRHDYLSFFKKEMDFRHQLNYPPYVFLCTLIFAHKEEKKAMQAAQVIKDTFFSVKMLGPLTISMRQRNQRVRLVIKAKDQVELNHTIWKIVHFHQGHNTSVKLDVNMYPLALEE